MDEAAATLSAPVGGAVTGSTEGEVLSAATGDVAENFEAATSEDVVDAVESSEDVVGATEVACGLNPVDSSYS